MSNSAAPALSLLLLAASIALPASSAPLSAEQLGRLRISQRPCSLNKTRQTCVITVPEGSEVMRIDFSAGDQPFWVFTPTGAPTTDRRPYRDAQGRTWLFSGHRSFQLVEQGPFRNVIEVESP
ncbi:hypothetical protein EVJ50_04040 [Synechococcus sp. RSCCF101]|uniref:hypothetical protein n=1 Tax=Synechococcus sp. RSCCF101 TaxID=2511069 RepID=UPI001244E3E8|nr:hypothetical protein [Synechococcus sp. RSCCF101]QEY31546.1 hypothetical protein EVJ50_04040 [Synechococcus sp. RSCCF101]